MKQAFDLFGDACFGLHINISDFCLRRKDFRHFFHPLSPVAMSKVTMRRAPSQVMYLMVGLWVYGHPGDCRNALLFSGVTISVRFAVAAFFVDFRTGVPAQSLLSLLETWNAWKRDPASVHISFLHQLTVSCSQEEFAAEQSGVPEGTGASRAVQIFCLDSQG